MDATKFAIIDLTWPTEESTAPEVTITLRDASEYEPDAELAETVRKHNLLIKQLVKTSFILLYSS